MVCLLSACFLHAEIKIEKKATTVTINDERVSVYFNDGDTFKVLDGSYKKSRVRIVGINTLENYGPVHSFMQNSADYLLSIAHAATGHVRKGSWHCIISEERDTYNRLLATCDDLARSLLEAGLAHAYSIDESPANQDYLRSQTKAQRKRVGMWKGGVPDFIITSLHSVSEGYDDSYNRLISAFDGHSEKWYHGQSYGTCENVCLDDDVCMIYVPFKLRYGNKRPECLLSKEH